MSLLNKSDSCNEDEGTMEIERQAFVNFKCDYIDTINDLNLLPLTPELPNCYMYTVLYSLSNLNKLITFLISSNKGQFSYLFDHVEENERLKHEDLVNDKRKFLIFWHNECFKYLLNLHNVPEHIVDFNQRFLKNFNLYELFDLLRQYCPMAEEDASLFLEFLLDNLSEVNAVTNYGECVENLFKTRFNNDYRCKNCLAITKGPVDIATLWRTSTENVNENESLVDSFFKTQILNPFNCESCKKNAEAEVLTTVSGKLPLCLIIQIGRIHYNSSGLFKSDKYLNFDENLVIQNNEYNLKSIIVHLGDGFNEGHYLVIVKKNIKNKTDNLNENQLWFVIDGDKYSCMIDINNEFVHKNAILLFYVQK